MVAKRTFLQMGVFGVVAFVLGVGVPLMKPSTQPMTIAQERGSGEGLSSQRCCRASDLSASFQRVAERIRPSVVSIRSKTWIVPPPDRLVDPFEMPDRLDELFEKRSAGRSPNSGPSQGSWGEVDSGQSGLGTGVIISRRGYVLTNSHVVDDADQVVVTLANGRDCDGQLVGMDEESDLAVLKIEADSLVPAGFDRSDAISVGDWVLAVGSPFGLDQSVTAGIISAKGRATVGVASYEFFIQTDAAINPGNSGGPLVNLEGLVIGINTAIASETGGYMGIGFAIPSNYARAVAQAIIRKGRVDHGRLGIVAQDFDGKLATTYRLDDEAGVLVGKVAAGSPAHKAGIQPGDVLVRYDGHRIESASQLRIKAAATPPGTVVEVGVYRDGSYRAIAVRIDAVNGKLPANPVDPPQITISPF